MTDLYKKLNRESDHIKLTADEKRAIRVRLFGAPTPVHSPVTVVRSPYVFFASHRVMVALASLVLVVFAGGSTAAYAAQGALPGEPLYALKTKVLEPVAVALAATPAAKAAVHVALAQRRVDEAELLAHKGALTATTSAELAANFESNAQSADIIAAQIATSDPATAVQIQTQLNASSAVGGAVLTALGNQPGDGEDRGPVVALALQVSARADSHKNSDNTKKTAATAPPKAAAVRAFVALSASSTEATGTQEEPRPAQTDLTGLISQTQNTAAQLEQKAQDALGAARAGFDAASSTLDASTTVAVQNSLAGIDTLISHGATAAGDSFYDTAVKDFTDALGRALRLDALLKAQQHFDNNVITPLLDVSLHGRRSDN